MKTIRIQVEDDNCFFTDSKLTRLKAIVEFQAPFKGTSTYATFEQLTSGDLEWVPVRLALKESTEHSVAELHYLSSKVESKVIKAIHNYLAKHYEPLKRASIESTDKLIRFRNELVKKPTAKRGRPLGAKNKVLAIMHDTTEHLASTSV